MWCTIQILSIVLYYYIMRWCKNITHGIDNIYRNELNKNKSNNLKTNN